MFVLRMGSYAEEISSWLPLIWPFLSRSVFNRPRSESLSLLSLSVNLTQSWKKNLRGNCVLIVNSTGLKFSYSTLPQSCFFWDYYISKSLTLFTASEIIYICVTFTVKQNSFLSYRNLIIWVFFIVIGCLWIISQQVKVLESLES